MISPANPLLLQPDSGRIRGSSKYVPPAMLTTSEGLDKGEWTPMSVPHDSTGLPVGAHEEFRKWFEREPEEYKDQVLANIEELSPREVATHIAWPELGAFSLVHFYEDWKAELDRRIDGYVYLLRGGGYCKIGRAHKPFERHKTLQIQLPFPVELLHVIPCEDYKRAEREFHEAYDKERVNGEWFLLDQEEIEYICGFERHNAYPVEWKAPTSRRELREIEEFLKVRAARREWGDAE